MRRWLVVAAFGTALAAAAPAIGQVPAPSGPPATIGLSEEQLRRLLTVQGFSEIEEMRREGDDYVGEAELHGERIPFRADARTGEVREPETLTEGQIRTLLAERGYSDVTVEDRTGSTYRARAERSGRPMDLRVDARRGTILHMEIRQD